MKLIHLPPDGTVVSLPLRRPVRLQVTAGRVWITQPGWPQDHWLEAGQTLDWLPTRRWRATRLILSGEGDSQITLKVESNI